MSVESPHVGAPAFVHQFDATLSTEHIQRLYGESGYFNVGYWSGDTPDLAAACRRLVDEVLTGVPTCSGWILDVGCGLGAGTRRIADRRPDATVLAGNISPWQLAQARARGVAAAVVMDAASLPIRSGAVDAVVAIESPQHFDTRARFLADAFRTLRAGGTLSMADMLFRDAGAIGDWLIPPHNLRTSIEAYDRLLRDCGFVDISLEDVTDVTWRPFCDLMRATFGGNPGRIDAIESSMSHYLLVRARRP